MARRLKAFKKAHVAPDGREALKAPTKSTTANGVKLKVDVKRAPELRRLLKNY
jgi:hypothetical protein